METWGTPMNLKTTLCAAAAALAAVAQPASAAITISSVAGTAVYSGPPAQVTFDGPSLATFTGGLVTNTSVSNVRAQPFGSTGNYWSVGPTDGSPGTLNLSAYGPLYSISFIWGSIDTFNTLEVIDSTGIALATFTGSSVFNPASGDQTNPATNRLVTILLSGSDALNARGLRLSSTQNAFEVDNFAINAVPEPGTWAMMLLGFAGIGLSMRRKRSAYLPAVA